MPEFHWITASLEKQPCPMQPMQSLRKHVNHVQSGTFTGTLSKTFCCQGQAVPKEQSSVFRYSMHGDSEEKVRRMQLSVILAVLVCFVRPGCFSSFITSEVKSTAQLQDVSRNTTSMGHYRCSVYCACEPCLVSVLPPSLFFCLLWDFSSFCCSLLKLFHSLSFAMFITSFLPQTATRSF